MRGEVTIAIECDHCGLVIEILLVSAEQKDGADRWSDEYLRSDLEAKKWFISDSGTVHFCPACEKGSKS